MPKQYLAEGVKGGTPFIVDKESAAKCFAVTESLPNGLPGWRIQGLLSEYNKLNGNNRKYAKSVWEKQMLPESTLQKLIKLNDCLGQLEHPSDGIITYNSPISHMVSATKLNEDGTVTGELVIFDTPEGKRIKAMIESGHNPKVSSRGFGTVTNINGIDEVQDDYVCEGWDIVMKPSFEAAVLSPALDTILGKTNESKTPVTEEKNLAPAPVAPAPTAAATPAASQTTNKNNNTNMNISEAKTQVAALKSAGAPKDIREAAEVFSKIQSLHNVIAEATAAEPKASYEGTKLHNELENFEATILAAQTAPSKEVTKLKENTNKVLSVTKAVVETALTYKTALAAANTKIAEQQKLIESLITKARGWVAVAESRKATSAKLDLGYTYATDALDEFVTKYNEDLSKVGGRVLNLEFKDKITPELTKAISEAKTPKAIIAIRESLAPKAAPAAPAPAAPAAVAPAAPVVEAAKAPVAEPTAVVESVHIVEGNRPFSVNESIAMAKRLGSTK